MATQGMRDACGREAAFQCLRLQLPYLTRTAAPRASKGAKSCSREMLAVSPWKCHDFYHAFGGERGKVVN